MTLVLPGCFSCLCLAYFCWLKRTVPPAEWQFAATGGGDSTITYPWGNGAPNASTTPEQRTGTVFPGPEHVGKYPAGASPFGILDLIGNVW